MKKVVVASVLAVAAGTAYYLPAALALDDQTQGAQSSQITIKDPAEYNAYTNAVGQSSPAAKASAIEQFLTQYPNSQVKEEMLESEVNDLLLNRISLFALTELPKATTCH